MSNYFDNQSNWSWNVSKDSVLVTTDHGSHTHTLDVTDVPIGEMADNTGRVMGDAHRAASHDAKEENVINTSPVEAGGTGIQKEDSLTQNTVQETSTALDDSIGEINEAGENTVTEAVGGIEDTSDGIDDEGGIDDDGGIEDDGGIDF